MKKEEFEKEQEKVLDMLTQLSNMELYCMEHDKSFKKEAMETVDLAIGEIRKMAERYLKLRIKEVPVRKLISCPSCHMEVGIEEKKCPWCSQVFT